MLRRDAVTRMVEKHWVSPRREKSQIIRCISQDKLKRQMAPKPLEVTASEVYFSPTYALWVTSWLCPMFPNQDPRNQVREREHDWWDCREKIDHGNSHTGSSYSLETTHNARISLGKASHMAKPAITAVGKYNFSQGEAVIIFER